MIVSGAFFGLSAYLVQPHFSIELRQSRRKRLMSKPNTRTHLRID